MTDKLKKLLYWVFMVVLLVILFTYWCNNNPYPAAKTLKESFETELYYAKQNTQDSDKLKKLETAINDDKQAPKELKDIFSRFKNAWPEKNKLPEQDCKDIQGRLDKAYEPSLSKAYAEAFNKGIACIGILVITGLFLGLSIFTALLRDPVSNPAALQSLAQPGAPPPMPPFSLSRTQIAVWITVISSLYVHFVFWKQGPFDGAITQTVLLLMGISAGTLAGAAIIDTSEIEQGIPRSQNTVTKNFFYDILSDNNGISMHRFQNVAWTVIAIMVYIYRYNNTPGLTKLPDLDATLVALTGISSATYLTLKTRENVPPADLIKNLKLQLITEATLDPAILTAINSSGFEVVTVKDNNGTIYKVVSGSSKREYIIDSIKPGSYTLTVETKITVNSNPVIFSGSFQGLVDGKINPLPIPLKKG